MPVRWKRKRPWKKQITRRVIWQVWLKSQPAAGINVTPFEEWLKKSGREMPGHGFFIREP